MRSLTENALWSQWLTSVHCVQNGAEMFHVEQHKNCSTWNNVDATFVLY